MRTLYRARADSPFGWLTCICDDTSIIRLLWASGNEEEAVEQLSRTLGVIRLAGENAVTQTVCHELGAYFDGHLHTFSVRPSFVGGSPFSIAIWQALGTVPYGCPLSYGELGTRCGRTGARAIGNAVGRNPVPILVPCHRILRAGGKLGGFGGGLPVKRFLLHLEGIPFTENFSQESV